MLMINKDIIRLVYTRAIDLHSSMVPLGTLKNIKGVYVFLLKNASDDAPSATDDCSRTTMAEAKRYIMKRSILNEVPMDGDSLQHLLLSRLQWVP